MVLEKGELAPESQPNTGFWFGFLSFSPLISCFLRGSVVLNSCFHSLEDATLASLSVLIKHSR